MSSEPIWAPEQQQRMVADLFARIEERIANDYYWHRDVDAKIRLYQARGDIRFLMSEIVRLREQLDFIRTAANR